MRSGPASTVSAVIAQRHGLMQQPARARQRWRRGIALRLRLHRRQACSGRGSPRSASAMHGLVAQPRAQAFAQLRPRHRLLRARIEQVAAGRHERRQLARQQAQAAHRCRHPRLFEPAAGEFEQRRRFAFGREQADRDLAVGATLRARAPARSAARRRRGRPGYVARSRGQAAQREQQRLAGFDLVVELDALVEHVRRPVQVQRQRQRRRAGDRGTAAPSSESAG